MFSVLRILLLMFLGHRRRANAVAQRRAQALMRRQMRAMLLRRAHRGGVR